MATIARPRPSPALRAALGSAGAPLHYLAIPPSVFATVIGGLATADCANNARVVLEKPFGRDLKSARELNAILQQHFPEESIFRIDHYLGKEPVQNILYTRFSNAFLEPIWNRNYIRSVQITMAEDFDVQGPRCLLRGGRRDPRRDPESSAAGAEQRDHGRAAACVHRAPAR